MNNKDYINNNIQESKPNAGLYLIATPIGNASDTTIRALELFKNLDFLYCENPKHSLKLLNFFSINRSLFSYNEHSSDHSRKKIINLLKNKNSVGLISDAGTPAISDPGFKLIKNCYIENIPVIPVPGASSVTAAISSSPLPNHNFHFLGFAPKKPSQIDSLMKLCKNYQGSIILFETARNIKKLVEKIYQSFPDSDMFLARELTKIYEEKIPGKTVDILKKLEGLNEIKGEFVVIFSHNKDYEDVIFETDPEVLMKEGSKFLGNKDLANFLSKITSFNKKELYNIGLKIKK